MYANLINRLRVAQLRGNTPPSEMHLLQDAIKCIKALTSFNAAIELKLADKEAEVARLRIRVDELESPFVAARATAATALAGMEASVAYVRIKKRAEAAEAEVAEVGELQRYTIMADTYITDNPNGEWLRADELEALLKEEWQ